MHTDIKFQILSQTKSVNKIITIFCLLLLDCSGIIVHDQNFISAENSLVMIEPMEVRIEKQDVESELKF